MYTLLGEMVPISMMVVFLLFSSSLILSNLKSSFCPPPFAFSLSSYFSHSGTLRVVMCDLGPPM